MCGAADALYGSRRTPAARSSTVSSGAHLCGRWTRPSTLNRHQATLLPPRLLVATRRAGPGILGLVRLTARRVPADDGGDVTVDLHLKVFEGGAEHLHDHFPVFFGEADAAFVPFP